MSGYPPDIEPAAIRRFAGGLQNGHSRQNRRGRTLQPSAVFLCNISLPRESIQLEVLFEAGERAREIVPQRLPDDCGSGREVG